MLNKLIVIWKTVFQIVKDFLRAELGEPPGAYVMVVLWALLGVALCNFFPDPNQTSTVANEILAILFYSDFVPEITSEPQFTFDFVNIAVPIALLAVAIHWLITQPTAITRTQQFRTFGLAIVLAVGAYLAPSGPAHLPWLFIRKETPQAIVFLVRMAWALVSLISIFALVVSRRHHLSPTWRAIITGSTTGAVLIIVLAYPVYTRVYPVSLLGSTYAGSAHRWTLLICSLLGAILILAAGPIAVIWNQHRRRSAQFVTGAIAGALAGTLLFGGLGGPVAGLVAHAPLYGVAESRVGYGPGEWLLELAKATNDTFPWTYSAFLLLAGGGTLVGGLTGWLTPPRMKTVGQKLAMPAHWPGAMLFTVFFLLAFVVIVNTAILLLLGPIVQNVFDMFGFVPRWRAEWIPDAAVVQPWLALIAVQVLSLYWLHRRSDPAPWQWLTGGVAMAIGFYSLIHPVLLYLMNWSFVLESWVLVISLVTVILGLEILAFGWSLWRSAMADGTSQPVPPKRFTRIVSGAATGGVFAAIFALQLTAAALSLVLIAIEMIETLLEETAPAPGLDWLDRILSPIFGTHLYALITLVGLYMTLGVVAGLGLAFWPWRWSRWLWRHSQQISHWGLLRQRWFIWSITAVGGVVLVVAIIYLPLALPVFISAVIALVVIRRRSIRHLPLPVFALAFAVSLAGLVGLTLRGIYSPPLDLFWLRLVYVLIVGPAAAVMYQALSTYTPQPLSLRMRLTALLGIALLVGVITHSSQEEVDVLAGVSHYDGRQWKKFSPDNSALGSRLNYQFFSDGQENLWFGGGSGVMIEQTAQTWRSYLTMRAWTDTPGRKLNNERALQFGKSLLFLEDKRGRLWVARDREFGQFDSEYSDGSNFALHVPGRQPTKVELDNITTRWQRPDADEALSKAEIESGIILVKGEDEKIRALLALNWPVTGMTLDSAGNIWAATMGGGTLRLEGDRGMDDAHWEFFTMENSGLASDDVYSIYADQSENVWFGTTRGLSRFDGTNWETFTASELPVDTPVVTFLEDSREMLGVGTAQGGYWWDGQDWTAFSEIAGWPDGASVVLLFEDSQGGLWAGTMDGALRFDGQQWRKLVDNLHVTASVEGPPSVIWIGGQEGLVRYNLVTNEQALFNSTSGLASDWIWDLHVDQDSGLWVSTFNIIRTASSPWWAIGLSVIFFGYLFANTYRGYKRTPEARAHHLAQQIIIEPDNLYPAVYALLADAPDAPLALLQLNENISRAGDQTGAEAVTALANLSSGFNVAIALEQSVAALKADSTRAWAEPLSGLHSLLALTLGAQRVPEIANLVLVVNPGQKPGDVSLRVQAQSIASLPPFLSGAHDQAWEMFERICVSLHKYQKVDAATDRLSYLANALTAVETAQTAILTIGTPEKTVMAAIVNNWRIVVTDEFNTVSGRAELRLELRTRQVRRRAEVTLGLRLQNNGRAVAENIVATLQPGEGFSPAGETQVVLERLSSGSSTPIEFTIAPTEQETARIICHATWSDRVADSNETEFADVVRFLDVTEEFRRILNPYIVGHPVKSAEMFHGREDIFYYIEDNLGGSVQDRTLVLHGQRRTGKTSILYQLLHGRLGHNFLPVLIDMQELALLVNNTSDFLSELAYQLARTVRKAGTNIQEPAPDAFEASPTRTFNRFLDTLEDHLGDQRVVVMFDEFELIERKITEGKLDADLLGYFRSLIQHRDHLVFIFTGTHRLEEMSHDYWSILFNIALYHRVSFLNSTDAARLIRRPVAGKLDVDELAIEKIISLTRGHPYFIQLTCWALVNHCNVQERNYATINDVNDAVQEILTSGEAHFAYIWQQANTLDRLALAGLAHTLQPGKAWARPAEVLEILVNGGDTQTQRTVLVDALDRLVTQEVLEVASEGTLRYRFQIEVLRLWVQATKSIAALVERGQ
ncbi:two-component regulator propeller domain-containing protein [Chloroflexota bacterium]